VLAPCCTRVRSMIRLRSAHSRRGATSTAVAVQVDPRSASRWQRPELRGPVRPSQFGESKPLPAPANSTDASGAECPQNVLTRDTDRQETNCRSDRRREGDRCAYSRSFDPPIAEGRLKCAELDLAAKVHRFDQRLILKAASRLFPTSVEKKLKWLVCCCESGLDSFPGAS
jgi:hypothetical protein